ncbi:MAG: glycosyl hydrolase family 8 [Fibrobacterales bacterium]
MIKCVWAALSFYNNFSTAAIAILVGLVLLNSKNVSAEQPPVQYVKGAAETGIYRNLFVELGMSQEEVSVKVTAAYQRLFEGDEVSETVYYEAGDSTAYILDYYSNDIRSEGMSYGMMIAVQMNDQIKFDKLWRFAKTYSQHSSGASEGYFSWQLEPTAPYAMIDPGSAPDGEEYFIMALYFAAHRWGNGEGIFNYKAEAEELLGHVVNNDREEGLASIFNLEEGQVRFAPNTVAGAYTDPSYHLPGFYKLWYYWADENNGFWGDVALVSEDYLPMARSETTHLPAEYMTYDGKPQVTTFNENSHLFAFDSWRVIMNVAMDCHWFGVQNWNSDYADKWLSFFYSKGINDYGSSYTEEGEVVAAYRSPGLIATNGTAALCTENFHALEFTQELWDMEVPSGEYRYYNGLVYMLSLLHAAGEFKVWGEVMQKVSSSSEPEGGGNSSTIEMSSSSRERISISLNDELSSESVEESSNEDNEMSSTAEMSSEKESLSSAEDGFSPLFSVQKSVLSNTTLFIGSEVLKQEMPSINNHYSVYLLDGGVIQEGAIKSGEVLNVLLPRYVIGVPLILVLR